MRLEAEGFSGALTGHFSVAKHGDAIHEDGCKSFAEVVGIADFGSICHGVWIKNHEVCDGADLDSSAVLNAKGVGRQAGHFANCFFEEEGALAADMLSDDSCIVAETAWVRHCLAESAWAAIAGDHGHGVGQEGDHVWLIHVLKNSTSTAVGFDLEYELDLGVERVGAEGLACGVGDVLSLERGVAVVAGDGGVSVVCSAPTLSHFRHFCNDRGSLLRMGDTGSECIASALARCVGD